MSVCIQPVSMFVAAIAPSAVKVNFVNFIYTT
jgi:hypothetical protein